GQTWPLIFVTLVALAMIIYLYHIQEEKELSFIWATSLISAGAIGNLIDRVYKQSVTDMFDLHFWPIFNIADVAITVGCLLFAYYFIRYSER
ncbi:MAG: signal peptidase II, partial [Vagococcus sp.]|nr:signal peptidase II [Vagococcus sp.]